MAEAHAHDVVPKGLLAFSLACVLAIPMGAPAVSAHTPTEQVLLSTAGDLQQVSDGVTALGGRVLQSFEVASSLVAELPASAPAPEGSFVVPNVTMKFNSVPTAAGNDDTNTFKQTIAVPEAASGSGVTVAVVDTGVDPSANIDVKDHVNVSGGPTGDGLGHGTFMAGLVAGDDQDFGGVASGAKVLDVQVADSDGSTDLSRVLAGLQAVADQRAQDPSLDVAMLALSTDSPLPPWMDPLTRALDRLWFRGVTVVVASGNDGPGELSSPATDPLLLVVGAVDEADTAVRDDDTVADFSSFGKAFGKRRPDLVAPGVSLISTAAPQSMAYLDNPGSHVGDGFLKGTGTSMSAAVAAGAVAVLLGERPGLTPDQTKRVLMASAYDSATLRTKTGAGQGGLDLAGALVEPVPPGSKPDVPTTDYGPAEADAATWAQFAQAWADGDVRALAKAWVLLSEQSRRWAATSWSMAALAQALMADEGTFGSRRWAGGHWATDNWASRRWATDEWVSRRWADEEWLEAVWESRRWASRRWAADDWLTFAWSLRMSETDPGVVEMWEEGQWDSRRWASRRWADVAWVSRRWASDAWESRRWADYSWDSRRWANDEWSSRRWADFTYESRRWANESWNSRRWAVLDW